MTVDGGGTNARAVRKRLITSRKSANHADRNLIGKVGEVNDCVDLFRRTRYVFVLQKIIQKSKTQTNGKKIC